MLDVALVILSLPGVACGMYLAGLAILSRASEPAARHEPSGTRFDVIVPAHDEERDVAATIESLLAMDYPRRLYRVFVVADNCTDRTAERAREAGALVLERKDESRQGKGYALSYGFAHSLREPFADAVVVVDADTTVTENLLKAFAAHLHRGALALQADYVVRNPDDSWRTRLMHLAFTLVHRVRSRARERVGVSVGLHGNGMAFASALLRSVPHEARSIVEDLEYGIRLALAGHRVEYVEEARVAGQMVAREEGSRSQRRRWEGGRLRMARQYAPTLLAQGLRARSPLLLDLAAELLVPPLAFVSLWTVLGFAGAAGWMTLGRGPWWAPLPWTAALIGLAMYVLRGAWLAGAGPRELLDLLWSPVYMLWRVALLLRSPGVKPAARWVRTARDGEEGKGTGAFRGGCA